MSSAVKTILRPAKDIASDCYKTPDWIFKKLNSVFKFNLDVCANETNHRCKKYYDVKADGRIRRWSKRRANWANIPYSQKKEWFLKANLEAEKGAVIGLLTTMDSLTNKSFGSKHISHIFVLRGRVKFEGQTVNTAFAQGSVLVIYNGDKVDNLQRLTKLTDLDGQQLGTLYELSPEYRNEESSAA